MCSYVKFGKIHLRSQPCFDKNLLLVVSGDTLCKSCLGYLNEPRIAQDFAAQAFLILKCKYLEAIASSLFLNRVQSMPSCRIPSSPFCFVRSCHVFRIICIIRIYVVCVIFRPRKYFSARPTERSPVQRIDKSFKSPIAARLSQLETSTRMDHDRATQIKTTMLASAELQLCLGSKVAAELNSEVFRLALSTIRFAILW